jgi:hypothetical protein
MKERVVNGLEKFRTVDIIVHCQNQLTSKIKTGLIVKVLVTLSVNGRLIISAATSKS